MAVRAPAATAAGGPTTMSGGSSELCCVNGSFNIRTSGVNGSFNLHAFLLLAGDDTDQTVMMTTS
eukprot:5326348-Prymnesium_polylepis.2